MFFYISTISTELFSVLAARIGVFTRRPQSIATTRNGFLTLQEVHSQRPNYELYNANYGLYAANYGYWQLEYLSSKNHKAVE